MLRAYEKMLKERIMKICVFCRKETNAIVCPECWTYKLIDIWICHCGEHNPVTDDKCQSCNAAAVGKTILAAVDADSDTTILAAVDAAVGKTILAAVDADSDTTVRASHVMDILGVRLVMDILEDGARWLNDQRLQFMTRKVVYQRADVSIEVNATVGKTIFQVDIQAGVRERIETRDYLIAADDLLLSGNQVLPKRGDHVREPQGVRMFVYEVMAPGKEPEWRYRDPYRQTLRIHTKLIGTEVASW